MVKKKDILKDLKQFQEDIEYVCHDYTRNKLVDLVQKYS